MPCWVCSYHHKGTRRCRRHLFRQRSMPPRLLTAAATSQLLTIVTPNPKSSPLLARTTSLTRIRHPSLHCKNPPSTPCPHSSTQHNRTNSTAHHKTALRSGRNRTHTVRQLNSACLRGSFLQRACVSTCASARGASIAPHSMPHYMSPHPAGVRHMHRDHASGSRASPLLLHSFWLVGPLIPARPPPFPRRPIFRPVPCRRRPARSRRGIGLCTTGRGRRSVNRRATCRKHPPAWPHPRNNASEHTADTATGYGERSCQLHPSSMAGMHSICWRRARDPTERCQRHKSGNYSRAHVKPALALAPTDVKPTDVKPALALACAGLPQVNSENCVVPRMGPVQWPLRTRRGAVPRVPGQEGRRERSGARTRRSGRCVPLRRRRRRLREP